MQVKNLEDILIFQCQQCFEFPKYPKWCNYCQRIYCLCCNKGFRQSNCNCENFSDIDPILLYIYNLLSIQCQICLKIFKLQEIKLHQRKCDQQVNKRDFSITVLKCFYCLNEISIGQQFQISYCNFCLKPFLNDERQIILTEEQIQQLDISTFRCELCKTEGTQIQLINHQEVCNQAMVLCDCELNHFKICLKKILEKEKQSLSMQQSILNLKNIQIGQKRVLRIFYGQLYLEQIGYFQLTQEFYSHDTSQLEQEDI